MSTDAQNPVDEHRESPNHALDQSRDLVLENGCVDSSRPNQRRRPQDLGVAERADGQLGRFPTSLASTALSAIAYSTARILRPDRRLRLATPSPLPKTPLEHAPVGIPAQLR